jgi:hypothetical protein
LRRINYQNTSFPTFIQIYASLLAKGWFTKLFISLSKLSLKDNFKPYFIILLFSKGLSSNSFFIIYASKAISLNQDLLLKTLL